MNGKKPAGFAARPLRRLFAAAVCGLIGLAAGAHNFWYENAWVSSDVLIQFLFHAEPAARGLESNLGERGAVYWTFPDDYPDRIITILREAKKQESGDRSQPRRWAAAPTRLIKPETFGGASACVVNGLGAVQDGTTRRSCPTRISTSTVVSHEQTGSGKETFAQNPAIF